MTDSKPSGTNPGFRSDEHVLNTDDLAYALDLIMNLGKPSTERGKDGTFRLFEIPFELKQFFWDDAKPAEKNSAYQSFINSDSYGVASDAIVKALDMDGDGKITAKDFQLMYDRQLMPSIKGNRKEMDKWLPLAGQCAFGVAVGLCFGALSRRLYRGRFMIAATGFGLYSGIQYLAQKNFVNQKLLEKAFEEKVKELADVNGDGEVNREDFEALVENRIRYISTKLGPGGLAPGAVGYGSLLLGFARGIRFI